MTIKYSLPSFPSFIHFYLSLPSLENFNKQQKQMKWNEVLNSIHILCKSSIDEHIIIF